MPDYIPERDGSFGIWLDNLAEYAAAHAGELPLSPEQVQSLADASSAFADAFSAHHEAQRRALAARAAKDEARKSAAESARRIVRIIQADPGLTDPQRTAMAITVPDRRRVAVPPPDDAPMFTVERSGGLRHVLRFGNADMIHRRRPEHTGGCEIWQTIVDEPWTEGDWHMIAVATHPPYAVEYPQDAAGKMARYRGRWFSTRGEVGPFGPTASATIAA